MDGAGKVLEDVPDPISKVKVEQVEIMNFGDGVYRMAFQSHGEEGGFKDAAEYAGVRSGIERYYIQRWSEGRSENTGLHGHSRISRMRKEMNSSGGGEIKRGGMPLYTKNLFLEGILVTQAESHRNR